MRRIRLNGVTGKPRLTFLTSAALDEFRYGTGNATGRPLYFTIHNDEMEFAPTPDQNYTLEMVYRATIPPLVTNLTNWLLTIAPDVYLYGALSEAMPYLKNDDRLQVWSQAYASAIDGLQRLGLTSTYNAGPLQLQASGVTP